MDTRALLLFLLLCSGSWAQNSSAPSECSLSEETRAEVVIILDGFNHISPDDFSTVKDSLQTLVPMLGPLGPDLVQIGLVKCGRDPEVEFYLNTFDDRSSVVDAVSRIKQSPSVSGGATKDVVESIRSLHIAGRGDRWFTPDILILFTDRNSSGVDTDLQQSLSKYYEKVFVVGVKVTDGLQIDTNDIEVFTVKDYNSISDIFEELIQSMCRWLKEFQGGLSLRITDVQPRRVTASWKWDESRIVVFFLSVSLDHGFTQVQYTDVLGNKRSAEISHLLPNTSYTVTVTARGRVSRSTQTVTTAAADSVRLVGGPGRCSGSVEVLMNGSWSRVCGTDFGLTEAAVVCEQLDCGVVSELQQEALFTEGPTFHCDGAETSLTACESSEETRCSTATNLTCSDELLRFDGFSCAGRLKLRHKDEWRPVMISDEPDLDVGTALCEQMNCGSSVSVKRGSYYSEPFWWLQPECVKQKSGLRHCLDLDLDSHMNITKGGLLIACSEFFPSVLTTVSSEGKSQSDVERVLLMLDSNFTVSCSLDEPFVPGQFHLLSPTGNYTLPPVNDSAHFLFQNFSPAHTGNYTCVYCANTSYISGCVKSRSVSITPGAPDSLLLIRASASSSGSSPKFSTSTREVELRRY